MADPWQLNRDFLDRRGFMAHMTTGLAGVALTSLLSDEGLVATATAAHQPHRPSIDPRRPLEDAIFNHVRTHDPTVHLSRDGDGRVLLGGHFDPAVASGPFVTTSTDILGILGFCGVAYTLI